LTIISPFLWIIILNPKKYLWKEPLQLAQTMRFSIEK
jgi:hypothetical protein